MEEKMAEDKINEKEFYNLQNEVNTLITQRNLLLATLLGCDPKEVNNIFMDYSEDNIYDAVQYVSENATASQGSFDINYNVFKEYLDERVNEEERER